MQIANLAGDRSIRYYETHAPDIHLVWAVIVDVLLLGTVIFVAISVSQTASRALRWTGAAVVGFFCVFAAYQLQRALRSSVDPWLTVRAQMIVKVVLLPVILFAIVKFPNRAFRLARGAFLILSPLFLVLAAQTIWIFQTNDLQRAGRGSAAGMLPGTTHTDRIIWIIFDELDNRMLFQVRPGRIHPVEFDRLRSESVYADHVKTPSDATLLSMPSLWTGRTVIDTKLNTSKLRVKFKGNSEWVDFASQPNIFRTARLAGFNTAVSGWHHPYCRILGNDLSDCAWDSGGMDTLFVERYLRQQSFATKLLYLVKWQSRAVPFLVQPAHYIVPIFRQNNIEAAQYLLANAYRMLQNRSLNLVLIHLPTPHPPGIWDTAKATFTTGDSSYIDNLQLTDELLGRIRRLLEQTGDWNRSAVIVSGDHPYRAALWMPLALFSDAEMVKETGMTGYPYVPFLLKLPHQREGVHYNREFNSVLTPNLILQLLNGKLQTPQDAVNWLDAHANSSETE